MLFSCRKYFIVAVLVCFICVAKGQNARMIEALTTKEGLSENVVTCIYQDKKGLLWFGTYDGLNCYDGYHFRIYRHLPKDSFSLPGNHIGKIWQDSEENFWIVTEKGTGILDIASGRFTLVFDIKTTAFERVNLFETGNDRICFIYNETWLYNKNTNNVKKAGFTNKSSEGDIVASFSPGGDIYVAKRNGNNSCWQLYKFNSRKNTFISAKKYPLNNLRDSDCYYIETLFADAQKRLWISERNTASGKCYIRIINTDGSINSISKKFEKVNSHLFVAQEKDNKIWLVSNNGVLYSWDDTSQKLDSLKNKENYAYISAGLDNKNILWLGTKGKGVIKYNALKSVFKSYAIQSPGEKLRKNTILGLFPYQNKYLFVLHDDDSLSKLNIADGRINSVHKSNAIFAFYQDQWNKFQKSQDTSGMIDLIKSAKDLPPVFSFSYFIVPPSSNKILYCDFGGGALRVCNESKTIILKDVTEIYHTWQGDTLWICNEANGLVAVHYPDFNYRRFLTDAADSFSISSDKTKYILFTPSGNLWIATDNGLNYFDKLTQKFYYYTERDGLCNNIIYCMAYDNNGRIWLGSGNGLSCFDTSSKKFTNFYTSDGLVNSEYNRFSAWCAPDGRMFMGGTQGIDFFDPDELNYDTAPPKVIISDFRLYDTHYSPGHLPVFSHDSNDITIAFTAVDYSYPAGNKFLYQMEGLNKDWILLQGSNTVHYSLLPPGNYTFKVKAANARGIWNEIPAKLSFIISPAWYNTWAFYALCALAAGAIIYFFIRTYIKRKLEKQKAILEKKQAIELERLRISSELHDDLGGGLSTIRLISEIMKNKTIDEYASKQLNTISDSSKELVQKMNEIVWALNVNNDNLQSLFAYMRQYIAKALDDAGIHCNIEMPAVVPEINISGNNRRNIFLMVKECVHNIIKHSKATNVDIEICLNENISIHIHDNGIGFSNRENDLHHFGVHNLKQRAKELNGKIGWQQNHGTLVKIEIPMWNFSNVG